MNFISSRVVWVVVLIFAQVAWIFLMILKLGELNIYITYLFVVLGVIIVVGIVRTRKNPSYKLAWTILILAVPILGTLLYIAFGRVNSLMLHKRKHRRIDEEMHPLMVSDEGSAQELEAVDEQDRGLSHYLEGMHYPVYYNEYSHYLSSGEEYFALLCEEICKAKSFIFMEYFIVEREYMWTTLLALLREKAAEGVEVRFMYDDVGSVWLLPRKYPQTLRKMGIQCRKFNEIRPFVSAIYNNRDHRKMTIIDGRVAFCGGVNLADEYINKKERFGHWKDGGIMLRGNAVWSFTYMYLGLWNSVKHTDHDYEKYRVSIKPQFEPDGFVQPYGYSPLDEDLTGENVYMAIINSATKYVYITTPYLIIDNEMMTALTLASKKGVDVRLITPHIPDKKYIFMLTRSYYRQLIDSGVRIFEYTPGFLHTKSLVCDDKTAVLGTVNLDYRSLYLHFECGAVLYGSQTVGELRDDLLSTMEKSMEIDVEFCRRIPWYEKLAVSFMSLVAPLL